MKIGYLPISDSVQARTRSSVGVGVGVGVASVERPLDGTC